MSSSRIKPRIASASSLFAAVTLSALLTGCSNLEFPWVYRINIDQGNIITQEMVDKLKPGMTRDQVKFVMGSPLIADAFHTDRWDYVYTLLNAKGNRTHQSLSVFFADDKLVGLNGDFMPGSAQQPPATGVN